MKHKLVFKLSGKNREVIPLLRLKIKQYGNLTLGELIQKGEGE